MIPSILVWSVLEILLLEAIQPVWYPYFGCWIIAGVVESLLLALQIAFLDSAEPFNVARLGVECLRMLVLLAMPLLTYCLDGRDKQLVDDTEERAALLGNNRGSQRAEDYGSIAPSESGSEDSENDPKGRAQMLEKMEKSGNWITYAKSFKVSYR